MRLRLLQIPWALFNLVPMHRLAMLARPLPPIAHGAFVEPEGLDDRLQRATLG